MGTTSGETRTTARGGVVRVFAALGDPTRARIVELLAESPTTATRLAPLIGMTRQAAMKHLGILADAGLIVGEKSGREVAFRLVPDGPVEAREWLAGIGSAWDRRLAAIKSAAEREPRGSGDRGSSS